MKKYSNFLTKLLSVAIVVGVLFYYQSVANKRAEAVAENEAAVREVEQYNAEILRAESEIYNDGTYEGEGTGFGGPIRVSVTIEDSVITSVTVIAHDGEDPAYYSQAEAVLDAVLDKQSTEVDTVSGATFSSRGILDAIDAALSQAVK
jgi:uncharacterized protein with FMN-binding domain